MPRVAVKPALLHWAAERSGLPWDKLAGKFSGLSEWEDETRQPTLVQLESFAAATNVPLGKLLLPAPPVEPLPLPDFRSHANVAVRHPSGNLLDTIYTCQIRQEWFRDFARGEGLEPVSAFRSAPKTPSETAERLRDFLRAPKELPRQPYSALRNLTELAEAAGVLVMASGVVGNNTRRKLSVDEFRGFVIADEHAPLIFINAADSLRAQVFTLAHELAHLLQGQSAVSEAEPLSRAASVDERWCNQAAAALLVAADALTTEFGARALARGDLIAALRARFPVSAAVVLIRAAGLGLIRQTQLEAGLAELQSQPPPHRAPSGGNFYNTQGRRLGVRFPKAVIRSTQEGRTPILDALRLLGLGSIKSFDRLAAHFGME